MVELAGWGFEGEVGGGLDVGLDVRGIFRGEEDDAGGVHYKSGLQHEVGEGFGAGEVGVGCGGPALAEGFVVDESGVDGAEVVGEGAVVDAEGFGGLDGGVERRPLVLQGAAVGGTLGEEGGDFAGAAADAEGADGSLLDFGFEEVEESSSCRSSCRSAAVASWRSQRSM